MKVHTANLKSILLKLSALVKSRKLRSPIDSFQNSGILFASLCVMIFSDTFQPAEEGDYVCCLGSEPQSYQQEVALRFCTSSPEQNILKTFFILFFVPAYQHQFEHLNSLMRQSQKILVFFKFFAHIRGRGSVHSAGNFHIVSVPV